jgi:hypothetical protein
MKERPILFSGEMVRAILDGRKKQTRRVIGVRNTVRSEDTHTNHNAEITNAINHFGTLWSFGLAWDVCGIEYYDNTTIRCPYGKHGDLLWVRESMRRSRYLDFLGDDVFDENNKEHPFKRSGKWTAQYIATGTAVPYAKGAKEGWCGTALWQWKNTACPSIHMPRWASRLILKITNVRAERLQDITAEDAFAEGISGGDWLGDPIGTFAQLWDSINAKRGYSWDSNPWVWAIEFESITKSDEHDVKSDSSTTNNFGYTTKEDGGGEG